MSDTMRPVPIEGLLDRVIGEFEQDRSIFGVPEYLFFENRRSAGGEADNAVEPERPVIGPAAGPHTQLAQNIITAYLTGGRFFELKTVQQLDTLDIEKPCIDARDECFNTEWSTEFTLEKAYAEYVKAWAILHLLKDAGLGRDFIFNMSVGYDLAGIQTEKMDRYIEGMIDASKQSLFTDTISRLQAYLTSNTEKTVVLHGRAGTIDTVGAISPKICPSVTLSTMHGCPPDEIEKICEYLLTKKKLHTYVKLNPTLLGFSTVREILDGLGFRYISLQKESFEHDLHYDDAVDMISRLRELASRHGLSFGVKLSNTLGVGNNADTLPGDEMYMSGRPLFPLTVTVAARLAQEFDGALPISFCGGVTATNVEELYACGVSPITMATDLLKPGGYLRLLQAAERLQRLQRLQCARKPSIGSPGDDWSDGIDVPRLSDLAASARNGEQYAKQWRGSDRVSVDRPLPLFDCYIAPCREACPIAQDIPEYIKLVSEKRYAEALSLIYEKNALPAITGSICDHQCMYNCTRLDYEGAVAIRDMKLIAAEQGSAERAGPVQAPTVSNHLSSPVAVIGAGPAGLSAALFLAREGFPVTVFEKEEAPGGIPAHTLPRFRITEEALRQDVEYIKAHNVAFRFGTEPASCSVEKLKAEGFRYLCYAIGAESDAILDIEGDNTNIIPSLQFLKRYHHGPDEPALGSHVAVVGGGNTAMDSARVAARVPGVKTVTVLYRRSEAEMPADREEYEAALRDGVRFHFLLSPESYRKDGLLVCRIMELGEPDSSGRRRPVETDFRKELHIDTIISAIGESVDPEMTEKLGLARAIQNGAIGPAGCETAIEGVFLLGDARRGPSTVVECIADGQAVARAIVEKETGNMRPLDNTSKKHETIHSSFEEINSRKACYLLPNKEEGERCLECSYLCNKCVEVCPNRSNIAVTLPDELVGTGFKDRYQIVHLDAFCNECGNCATFCPYQGKPYLDKLTLFNARDDFERSRNSGFYAVSASSQSAPHGGAELRAADRFEAVLLRLEEKVERIPVSSIISGSTSISTSISTSNSTSNPQVPSDWAKAVIGILLKKYPYLFGPVEE
jgi:putative selenate reductase